MVNFSRNAKSSRFVAACLAVAVACSAVAALASAAPVGIYRNAMNNDAQRKAVSKLVGESCGRGGDSAFRVRVGKRTRECLYRTPVIGRDLEIAAVGRVLSGTPKSIRRAAFVSVSLRTGGAGAGYQLLVFPLQRKAQLTRKASDGGTRYLAVKQNVRTVKGVGQANQLRLRAFNVTSGPDRGRVRILAFVGAERVADVTDDAGGELEGRATAFSVGATKAAKGLVGSIDDVVLRVPNPFE
jgi:hypothetical protein